jgi:hypothetical protein
MFRPTRRFWIGIAFVLVTLLTINFALRGVQGGRRLRTRPDEPIQAWMNIGHIAHSYHVPPDVLHEALGLPPEPDRRPLRAIAAAQGETTDALIARIEKAITDFRAARGADGPGPPRPPEPPRTP